MTKLGLDFDGAELKQLRKRAKITQEELADMIGLTRETVSAIENNRPSAIKGLTWNTVSAWQEICCDKADELTRNTFKQYLIRLLKL
jgi:transcriptional regulator with XRE-family HTH domain